MKALRKQDNYRMYKVGDYYELWHGKYNTETDVLKKVDIGVRVGYVSNPDNFLTAVHEAEMEFMSLNKEYELYG